MLDIPVDLKSPADDHVVKFILHFLTVYNEVVEAGVVVPILAKLDTLWIIQK